MDDDTLWYLFNKLKLRIKGVDTLPLYFWEMSVTRHSQFTLWYTDCDTYTVSEFRTTKIVKF